LEKVWLSTVKDGYRLHPLAPKRGFAAATLSPYLSGIGQRQLNVDNR